MALVIQAREAGKRAVVVVAMAQAAVARARVEGAMAREGVVRDRGGRGSGGRVEKAGAEMVRGEEVRVWEVAETDWEKKGLGEGGLAEEKAGGAGVVDRDSVEEESEEAG